VSFDPIAFAPGSVDVASEAGGRAASTARLLRERPSLGLTLRGSAGPEDRDILAERLLIERIAAGDGLPELSDTSFFARRRIQGVLEARGRGEAGELTAEDAPLLLRYIAATEVPTGRFTELAKARADSLRSQLEGKYDIAAVRLAVESAPLPGPPQVELVLGLAVEADPVAAAASVR
jgi:hypothetical protein